MNEKLKQADADAITIMGCLGPLAAMVLEARTMAANFAQFAASANQDAAATGEHLLENQANALRDVRVAMAEVMEKFGEHFNNGDCANDQVIALSSPMYDLLSIRREGNDFQS